MRSNSKSKKAISAIITAALVFSLFTAFPITASAADDPFQVTEDPVGAIYVLNQTAVPIKATFMYDVLADLGTINDGTPIKVQWFWSSVNSNTGRENGFGESTVPYSRQIEYKTTLTPKTDTAGVRYYYAVISYGVNVRGTSNAITHIEETWTTVQMETATEPARIEVIAPVQEQDTDFRVRKVDGDGNPLAGAVIELIPDEEYGWGEQKSYTATSGTDGYATFTVSAGAYILREKQAPTGYNATDETHLIRVGDDGQVFEVIDYRRQQYEPYETIILVNKKIPVLRDDHFAYMQGYPEGDFRPTRNMTRAEAVVMFSRLLSESMHEATDYYNSSYYPDVPAPPVWYSNQVCYMYSQWVLMDFSRDGRFRPNEPVTRAEFATLAAHFDNLTLTDANNFSDLPGSHWAVKYINSAAAKGWITGYPDGTFKPEGNITREEVVTLVNRMLNRKADKSYLSANAGKLPRNYWDLKSNRWSYLDIMEASTGHDHEVVSDGEQWTKVYN